MTIFDLVTSENVRAFYDNAIEQINGAPYLGEVLFPNDKQLGTTLEYIREQSGLGVELALSNFDAKTTLVDRAGFEEVKHDMPFFKQGTRLDEKLRQKLLNVIMTKSQVQIDMIMKKVFETETNLIKSARISRERMRMQLLATGIIKLNGNGVAYTYDFKVPAEHKKTLSGVNAWNKPETADPINDLIKIKLEVEQETGEVMDKVIMNSVTFGLIAKNKLVKAQIAASNNGIVIITDAMVKAAVESLTNLQVVIYDKMYKDAQGKAVKFYPDNQFTMLPAGNLGRTVFGTTPEEADLMSGATEAEVAIIDTGVAITTTKEVDPVNVFTKVSQVVIPTFEQANNVVIVDVIGE